MIRLDITNTGTTLLPDVMYCGGWNIIYVVVLSEKKFNLNPSMKKQWDFSKLIDIMQNNRPGLLKKCQFHEKQKEKMAGKLFWIKEVREECQKLKFMNFNWLLDKEIKIYQDNWGHVGMDYKFGNAIISMLKFFSVLIILCLCMPLFLDNTWWRI